MKIWTILFPVLIILGELFFSLSSSVFNIPASTFWALFLLAWMVLWWVFEVLPMGVTALIPLVFLPLAGVLTLKQVAAFYSNPVIYLFLGGFILARALQKTRLSEVIAIYILSISGRSDRGIIIGFIIATAFLSMWISNTATTVMMVPIALSVLAFLDTNLDESQKPQLKLMGVALFLAIAYSANIGGIMTPVGTPPNVVLLGYLEDLYQVEIDFWRWMAMACPIALILLVLKYLLLNFLFPYKVHVDKEFRVFIKEKLKDLGPLVATQKVTLTIFLLVCFLWVFKGVINEIVGSSFLNDTSTALFGGILLFLIPAGVARKQKKSIPPSVAPPVLDISDISELPWNIVLLFGGGMAMAGTLKEVGFIQASTQYFSSFNIASEFWLIFILAGLVLFLTEIMSNVALCVVALPVLMSLAVAQDINPLYMGIPAALCSSFAFSMPISTPPNAIVFGTNQVRMKDMLRIGIILNFIAWFTVMSLGWFLMKTFIH